MSEYAQISWTPHPLISRDGWDTGRLWQRVCSGLQGALHHLRSATSPSLAGVQPAAPACPLPEPLATPVDSPEATPAEGTLPESALQFPWTVVLSDTDNDFRTVLQTLRLTGLCDQNGCWNPEIRNIQVVHTGDWLNKWDPNPYVLDGFKRLQETTPEGCRLVLLNGNHELSILQMADKGLRTPLTEEDLHFIRRQNLLHVDQGTLFLHGYPSADLLLILKQFQRENVHKEAFNNRLQELFFEGSFPLFREARSLRVIGDIKSPKFYYNQRDQNGLYRGEEVAAALRELGLTTVIHGHKPGSEVQSDYELPEEVPGIRLINNDNRIRQTQRGGLLFSAQGDVLFINPHTVRGAGSEKSMKKRLCKLLGTRRKNRQTPQGRADAAVRMAA
ncbi:MAG: metallophosphoesterase [Magnetococcales bacterium]|nr:metallophosphoesterase [Magnetococcales bacterium]